MESITDCAFSWPISRIMVKCDSNGRGRATNVGSNQPHFADDFFQYYELCAHS